MERKRITAQSREDLGQFYDLARGWAGPWVEPITAMRELVSYLGTVDFPPQWVFTSHENLVFARRDDYRTSVLTVHPLNERRDGTGRARYEVRRPAPAPWSHSAGYAEDPERAWELIRSVLLDLGPPE